MSLRTPNLRLPSEECSLKMSLFEQDLSNCLDRNPLSPISVSTVGRKRLPMPTWGRHKYTVNIQELSDEIATESSEENSASNKNQKIVNKPPCRKLTINKKRQSRSKQRKLPKRILEKNTRNFKIIVTADRLRDWSKETKQARSERLQFESKRKAFYLNEGVSFKNYHLRRPEMMPKNLLLSSSSSSSDPSYVDYYSFSPSSSSSDSLLISSVEMRKGGKFENSRKIQEERKYLEEILSSSDSSELVRENKKSSTNKSAKDDSKQKTTIKKTEAKNAKKKSSLK